MNCDDQFSITELLGNNSGGVEWDIYPFKTLKNNKK